MGFFTDTMTVYNYRREEDGEKWLRTVVKGVQWRHGKRRMTASEGVFSDEPEETITVDFGRQYDGNTPFLLPLEYQKLPVEEAKAFWTLDHSNGMDVVVYGEVTQEVGEGYSISQLKKDFPYVFSVVSLADNRNRPRLKTLRVVAK